VDDGLCRSTADVQLFNYISNSNPSILLNQSINLFIMSAIYEVVGQPEQSSSTLLALPLLNLSALWYTFLYVIQFPVCCANIL
jgi:hypothetical protein